MSSTNCREASLVPRVSRSRERGHQPMPCFIDAADVSPYGITPQTDRACSARISQCFWRAELFQTSQPGGQ
eukprot:6194472-Pleurochrysis_carterae.AAC.1